jgi:hypothetical protein
MLQICRDIAVMTLFHCLPQLCYDIVANFIKNFIAILLQLSPTRVKTMKKTQTLFASTMHQ